MDQPDIKLFLPKIAGLQLVVKAPTQNPAIDDGDCQICCTDFPEAGKSISCACGFKCCEGCVKRCLLMRKDLPYCESCNNAFTMDFLIENCGRTWMTKSYRDHRKSVLFDREKAQFPETMDEVVAEKRRRQFNEKSEPLRKQKAALQKQIKYLNDQIKDPEARLRATKKYNQATDDEQVIGLFKIYMRKWKDWTSLDEEEMDALKTEISALKDQKKPLFEQRRILEAQIKAIRSEFYGNIQHTQPTKEKKTKFTQKCPVEKCPGFLSKQWVCELCKTKTCNKCLEIKDDLHVCDPNDVETAKLIKQETKNCPGCGMGIHRISGCSQMWCTQCHIAFNYNTGKKIDGNIHNPHFFQWARENGQEPAQGIGNREHLCGQRLDAILPINKISPKLKGKVSELFRLTLHFQDTVLNRARTNTGGHVDNIDLRLKYMLKDQTESRIKTTLITRDNKRNKEIEFIQIYEFLCTVMMESIYSIKMDYSDENIEKVLQDVKKAKTYANEQLGKISKAFGHKAKVITDEYTVLYIGEKARIEKRRAAQIEQRNLQRTRRTRGLTPAVVLNTPRRLRIQTIARPRPIVSRPTATTTTQTPTTQAPLFNLPVLPSFVQK